MHTRIIMRQDVNIGYNINSKNNIPAIDNTRISRNLKWIEITIYIIFSIRKFISH